jgi:hypothetical protein
MLREWKRGMMRSPLWVVVELLALGWLLALMELVVCIIMILLLL